MPGSESLPPAPGRLALIPLAFRSTAGGAGASAALETGAIAPAVRFA